MTHLRFILYIVFVLSLGNAFGQTHIYERYASWTDLEVAYLENVPLDSSTSVNVTILIAKDSAVWVELLKSFHIQPNLEIIDVNQFPIAFILCDRINPENIFHRKIMDSYYLCVNFKRFTISIYQYNTLDQYQALLSYMIKKVKQVSNEKK